MSKNKEQRNDGKKRKYICEYCDKKIASKYSLDRHKMVCKKREDNVKIVNENLINVNENLRNVNQNFKKEYTCNKCSKGYNTLKNYEEHVKRCKGLSILTCPRCMKTFSSRFSKSNHIKRNNCKARSIIYANTPSQINITNNIIINNYGNERMDYITFDEMIKLLKESGLNVILRYIQMKHFNKKFPENNNIKYDIRNGCLIRKNDEWRNI